MRRWLSDILSRKIRCGDELSRKRKILMSVMLYDGWETRQRDEKGMTGEAIKEAEAITAVVVVDMGGWVVTKVT